MLREAATAGQVVIELCWRRVLTIVVQRETATPQAATPQAATLQATIPLAAIGASPGSAGIPACVVLREKDNRG